MFPVALLICALLYTRKVSRPTYTQSCDLAVCPCVLFPKRWKLLRGIVGLEQSLCCVQSSAASCSVRLSQACVQLHGTDMICGGTWICRGEQISTT
jgi:hypothetical protein